MTYVLFGFGLLILLYIGGLWATRVPPATILNAAKWIFVGIALCLGLVAVATGRWNLIWMVAVAGLPWIIKLSAFLSRVKTATGGNSSGESEIETGLFSFWLDHESGQMDGRIRSGVFAGQCLSDLQLEDILILYAEAQQHDTRAVPILETYLDRSYPHWRQIRDEQRDSAQDQGQNQQSEPETDAQISTRLEALQVLGLADPVDDVAIREAHRRLMKQAHPDVGGSDAWAARLNQAKEFLLGSS